MGRIEMQEDGNRIRKNAVESQNGGAVVVSGNGAGEIIRIGLGEGVVARAPAILASEGIGCCVTLTLHDAQAGLGGMAHILLPESPGSVDGLGAFACADTALAGLLERLCGLGGQVRRLAAKLAGGASMFPKLVEDHDSIGRSNSQRLRSLLQDAGIPLTGHDLGGHHGRTVEFHLATGTMRVFALDHPMREF